MNHDGRTLKLEVYGAEASEAWRAFVADAGPEPQFETIGPDGGFAGRYSRQDWGGVEVTDIRLEPLLLRDGPANGDGAGADVLVQLMMEGRASLLADGAAIPLRVGHVLLRRARSGALVRAERTARIVTLALAAFRLAPHLAGPATLDGPIRPLEAGLPARLIHSLIAGQLETGTPPDRPDSFIDALVGLIALAVGRAPESAPSLPELAASRTAAILDYLRRNYANPQLTPLIMAEDLGISVRYTHKLLQQTGRSFRQELIALRLAAARAAFAANRRPRPTIADIAISVGFNDLSQFNRHFRTAYGLTPRTARRLDEITGFAGQAPPAPDLSPSLERGDGTRRDRGGAAARSRLVGAGDPV